MVACMLLRAIIPPPTGLDRGGTRLGQWIIGTMMGASFSFASIRAGVPYIPVLLGLVVFTSVLCLLNGWLLHRLAGVDANTGFLGSLPGAAVSSVALAEDLKADPFMVVMLMYTRVLLLILLVPLFLSPWIDPDVVAATRGGRAFSQPTPVMALLSVALALGAARLLQRLRVPSANYLGPFLLFILLRALRSDWVFGLPAGFFPLGMLLLGTSVGARFDLAALRKVWRPVLIQVGLVCGLLIACLGSGYVFHRLTGVDLVTAVLCTTPGGKESMTALSIEIGGNVELVIVMHTVRWLLVLFLGPAIAIAVATWVQRSTRVSGANATYPAYSTGTARKHRPSNAGIHTEKNELIAGYRKSGITTIRKGTT